MSFREKWQRLQRRRQRAIAQAVPTPEPEKPATTKEGKREKFYDIDPAYWRKIRDAMYARGGSFSVRALLYDLMFNGCMSIGEATALTSGDFHFEDEEGVIYVNITKMKDAIGTGSHSLSKHHKPRTNPIKCTEDPNDLGVKLRQYLKLRCPTQGSPLFPLTKNNYLRLMQEDAKRFGFKFRSHDFRRTFLTDLGRSKNVSLLTAAQMAGHRKVATTEIYFGRVASTPEARAAAEQLAKRREAKN